MTAELPALHFLDQNGRIVKLVSRGDSSLMKPLHPAQMSVCVSFPEREAGRKAEKKKKGSVAMLG